MRGVVARQPILIGALCPAWASVAPPPARKERPASAPSLENAARSRMREPTPAVAREPSGASIPPPPRVERSAPVSSPYLQPARPTSQPMSASPAPGLPLVDEPPTPQPDQLFSARRLLRVPPEPVPRPAPVISESPSVELSQGFRPRLAGRPHLRPASGAAPCRFAGSPTKKNGRGFRSAWLRL